MNFLVMLETYSHFYYPFYGKNIICTILSLKSTLRCSLIFADVCHVLQFFAAGKSIRQGDGDGAVWLTGDEVPVVPALPAVSRWCRLFTRVQPSQKVFGLFPLLSYEFTDHITVFCPFCTLWWTTRVVDPVQTLAPHWDVTFTLDTRVCGLGTLLY